MSTEGAPYRFRALSSRNYRLFFAGQLISMVGTWMQSMAQSWLVYRLSHSAYWLGTIAFVSQIAAFLLCPVAGVIADRVERRKVLLWVSLISMLQAFVLAALTFSGRVRIPHIAVLASILGIANAFEITTRHAFAVDLVGIEDLSSAIALNSATINGTRVIGPAIAGVVLGLVGEAWCFLLNALSFLAVIASLLLIPRASGDRTKSGEQRRDSWRLVLERFLADYRAALSYVRSQPRIAFLLVIATLLSFLGFPYAVLLPVYAERVLHGNADTLAWLSSSAGLGAVISVLTIGMHSVESRIERQLRNEILFLGLAAIVLGLSRSLPVSLVGTFFIGYFLMGAFPKINTTIQTLVSNTMRGRVLSLYTMSFLGSMPIGSFLAGWLADHIGAPGVMLLSGSACVTVALGLQARHRFVAIPAASR